METRQYQNEPTSNDRMVEGYAVIFDSPSEDIGWTEQIKRGAITEEIIKNSDVIAKLNHDDQKVLARSKNGKGSLLLEVDDKGLRYLFEAPCTAAGDELLEYLKRGDITSSSFAFSIDGDKADKWYKNAEGKICRDIYHIKALHDISPVFQPAYEATSCAKRYKEVMNLSAEIDNKMDALIADTLDL